MNTRENGVYSRLISIHAPPPEVENFLEFTPPDSTAPVMNLVILRGPFCGLFPGHIVSDEKAKGMPESRIAGHIRPGDEVDYVYDEEGLLVTVARYCKNGPDSIDGLSLWAKDPVPVCWEEIKYDEEAIRGDSGPVDWR